MCEASAKILDTMFQQSAQPVKALAMEGGVSQDLMYKAAKGLRTLPHRARLTISKAHLIGGLAMAREATGYRVFELTDGDRHIQNMLQRVIKEDTEADELIKKLPQILIDKTKAEDLTPELVVFLKQAAVELSEEITCSFNLLVELDNKFKLGILNWMTNGKHDPGLAAQSRV